MSDIGTESTPPKDAKLIDEAAKRMVEEMTGVLGKIDELYESGQLPEDYAFVYISDYDDENSKGTLYSFTRNGWEYTIDLHRFHKEDWKNKSEIPQLDIMRTTSMFDREADPTIDNVFERVVVDPPLKAKVPSKSFIRFAREVEKKSGPEDGKTIKVQFINDNAAIDEASKVIDQLK